MPDIGSIAAIFLPKAVPNYSCMSFTATICITDIGKCLAGGGMPIQRGASLTTNEHIDPASPPAQLAEMEDPDKTDVPEGAVPFNVSAEEIADAIAEESGEVRISTAGCLRCLTWF